MSDWALVSSDLSGCKLPSFDLETPTESETSVTSCFVTCIDKHELKKPAKL